MRRSARANPTLETILDRIERRDDLLSKRSVDGNNKRAKDNLLERERVQAEAERLYDKYKDAGVKWAACVQAVKTNWIPSFENKWHDRAIAAKKSESN